MAKVKRRFIVITSEGPVWEFGGPFAPLTIPFKCNVKSILNLIKYEQLEVYGINAAGAKVRLDETNYDDSDAPADRDIPSSPPSGGGPSSGGNPPPPPPPSAPTLKPPNVPPPTYTRDNMPEDIKKERYESKSGFDANGDLIKEDGESDESYNNRKQHIADVANGYTFTGIKDPNFVPGVTKMEDPNKPYLEMTAEERKKYRGGKEGFDENGVLLQKSNESDEEYLARCKRAGKGSYDYNGELEYGGHYYPRIGEDLSPRGRLHRSYYWYDKRATTKPELIKRQYAGKPGFDPNTGLLLQRPGESDENFKIRKRLAGTFGYDDVGNLRQNIPEDELRFRVR